MISKSASDKFSTSTFDSVAPKSIDEAGLGGAMGLSRMPGILSEKSRSGRSWNEDNTLYSWG